MKYLILLCDGMADLPVEKLGFATPMEKAHKPVMDFMSENGFTGMVKTVPDGVPPGSDTANLSVMGYDPKKYYTGRAPIEAVSMGIDLQENDVAFRVNLVTLSDEKIYSEKSMMDYSADEITDREAKEIIESVNENFRSSNIKFYPGKSYRHCLVWKNAPVQGQLTPPHDILTKKISDFLPKEKNYSKLLAMMEESHNFLKNHKTNLSRIEKGLNPANSIWIWGQGKKPSLPSIYSLYGINGSVVAAVDLIFGLGICSGLDPITVPGATGNLHTNFEGKAAAAISEFKKGKDYVYLHVEAPDECGHRNEVENKVRSIELIDQKVLSPLYDYLSKNKADNNENFRILVLPDHPTPLSLRTHTSDPVPFLLFDGEGSNVKPSVPFSEKACAESGVYFDSGPELFSFFIK